MVNDFFVLACLIFCGAAERIGIRPSEQLMHIYRRSNHSDQDAELLNSLTRFLFAFRPTRVGATPRVSNVAPREHNIFKALSSRNKKHATDTSRSTSAAMDAATNIVGPMLDDILAASTIPELMKTCGLERFTPALENQDLRELQTLLSKDKDTLLDILIDAQMKTNERRVFLEILRQRLVHEDEPKKPISRVHEDEPKKTISRPKTLYSPPIGQASDLTSPALFLGDFDFDRYLYQKPDGSGRMASGHGHASAKEEEYESEVSAGVARKGIRYEERREQLYGHQTFGSFCTNYIFQHSLAQDRLDVFFDKKRSGGPVEEDLFVTFDLTGIQSGKPLQSAENKGELTLFDKNHWKFRYLTNTAYGAFIVDTEYNRVFRR